MSHHLVEARNLSFSYPDGTPALKDVNFRITHGESVAFIGASGAGKSTLIHHLNGYLMPQAGEVRIGEVPVTRETVSGIRRTVGMLFQDPDDQLFMPTVSDDVAFGPLNLGLPRDEVDQRVTDSLSVVGIEHLRDRPPYKLSGGEKRAAAIACVIAGAPDILAMDEPSSDLDPWSRRQLIQLLAGFKHTKIIATHDLDLALDLCERVIVLHKGEVRKDGKTREIFSDEEMLLECHLEKPLRMQT
ncbi:MAG: energy-coupling factor ABC transporter ATP-binding protein [Verrucomicrobia bacterium]|nr:energy-coupling factor ABC transporter ATP-binding protein [Verrucomicrobiota bacterium]